ncbi:MAG: DUF6776 family protein [Steroidobacteraceae bacterium]
MREDRRRLKPWRAALLVLAGLAICYGAFEFGRRSAGYSIAAATTERLGLSRRNRALDEENESLQHRVAVAEVGQRVDRQAQTEAQRMIGELQAETARQRQELQFYRGLVARQFGAGILRVQELRIRPEEERRYRVLITLVQAATRNALATGNVTFTIEGSQRGAARTLTLPEIEAARRRALPFSLRFFQQIEVPIELPLEFEPSRLHVEYRVGRNSDPTRQSFNWRVEGEGESPVL